MSAGRKVKACRAEYHLSHELPAIKIVAMTYGGTIRQILFVKNTAEDLIPPFSVREI